MLRVSPATYRKLAIKKHGKQKGTILADAYQRKYYESQAKETSGKKGTGAKVHKEGVAIEKATSRKGFKPVSAKEYFERLKEEKQRKKEEEKQRKKEEEEKKKKKKKKNI